MDARNAPNKIDSLGNPPFDVPSPTILWWSNYILNRDSTATSRRGCSIHITYVRSASLLAPPQLPLNSRGINKQRRDISC